MAAYSKVPVTAGAPAAAVPAPAATEQPARPCKPLTLSVVSSPSPEQALTNCVFVNPDDAMTLTSPLVPNSPFPSRAYVQVGEWVYSFLPSEKIAKGTIGMSTIHRRINQPPLALNDVVLAVPFAPSADMMEGRVFLASARFEVETLAKAKPQAGAAPVVFNAAQLADTISLQFAKQWFTVGQQVLLQAEGVNLVLTLKNAEVGDAKAIVDGKKGEYRVSEATRGIMLQVTDIKLEKAAGSTFRLEGGVGQTGGSGAGLFKFKNLDPEKLGVGGLDKEFMELVRRTLALRVFPPSVMERLDVKPVRGLLLYGPPGTGKTLMARTIGKMLNGKEPKVVQGPSLFNKYVGETEKNIRDLFADAIKEYESRGAESDLHVIVLDEIDALCKTRGSRGDGTGVGDSAVNQLLSLIDGVNPLNNILVIGMTNRIDMLDEALLRPGRLEVHIEVGLPDEKGRLQIFRIHTRKMAENKLMSSDVDLPFFAHKTKNFTGSDIEGLVRNAVSFALASKIDFTNIKEVEHPEDIRVTSEHFIHALEQSNKPAFGMDEEDLARCYTNGIVPYGVGIRRVIDIVRTLFAQVRDSPRTPLVSCLLMGHTGCGKTALAANLAATSGFPFVKLVSPDDLVRVGSESARCSRIVQAFEDAYCSPMSVIILDDIERLLDYVPVGPRFSNIILQALLVLIKKRPTKPNRKLLVLGTTSAPEVLREMGLFEAFNAHLEIPPVSGPAEMKEVVTSLIGGNFTAEVALQACGAFPPSAEIPVKKLIMLVEMARQYSDPLRQGGLLGGLAEASMLSSSEDPLNMATAGLSHAQPVSVPASSSLAQAVTDAAFNQRHPTTPMDTAVSPSGDIIAPH